MRPVRTAVIGLLVACVTTAAPVAALAAPGDQPLTGTTAGVGETDHARAALEAVEQVFRGGTARRAAADAHSGRQLTLLLRDLRLSVDELDGEERERAEAYLARPDGAAAFLGEPLYDAGVPTKNDCAVAPTAGSRVCVHWVTSGQDAPPPVDSDGDGVPNQVETTRDVLNEVWTRVVDDGGYRAPRSDVSSANHGPDEKLDVYLADLGASRLYGYCSSDDPSQSNSAVSSFCAVDDDFAVGQFGGVPLENLQVTVAHEFFHAVQFAYDSWEDAWLLEGTAAWIEDELYDDVDDNLQYLADSPLTHPHVPMDYAGGDANIYGSWIFWRHLSERFPDEDGTGLPLVIRDVIGRIGGTTSLSDEGDFSTQAMVGALSARGASFSEVFSRFGTANRRPAATYEEGAAYPVGPLAGSVTVRSGKAKVLSARSDHLSNTTFRVVPAASLTGKRWKLKVGVDLPKRSFGYAATVTTVAKSGAVTTDQVRLAADGDGSLATVFGRQRVKAVEVTLTNASVRTTCWTSPSSPYACFGDPTDDGRVVKATVKAVR